MSTSSLPSFIKTSSGAEEEVENVKSLRTDDDDDGRTDGRTGRTTDGAL